MLACTGASAQGALLKKMGDKAKSAAEKKLGQKVEQTVGDKVGNILGVKDTPAQTAPAAGSSTYYDGSGYSSSSSSGYAENLMDTNGGVVFVSDVTKSSHSFSTYAEALKARPDWPSDSDLTDLKSLESYLRKLEDYSLAVSAMCGTYMSQQASYSEQNANGSGYDERCNAISNELADIYSNQLQNAVSQMTVSITSVQSLILGGKSAVDDSTLGGALFKLQNQIKGAWPNSQECHMVNQLESKSSDKSSRQKQNEIIDRWNKQQLQRWLATLRRFDESNKVLTMKVVELDNELEGMSASVKKTSSWSMAKSQSAALNGLISNYANMPKMLFDCPMVRHAWLD